MAKQAKTSKGFKCWSCGKSVPAQVGRAGEAWTAKGEWFCSKECAEKNEARVGEILERQLREQLISTHAQVKEAARRVGLLADDPELSKLLQSICSQLGEVVQQKYGIDPRTNDISRNLVFRP